jgi:hypothetical protein
MVKGLLVKLVKGQTGQLVNWSMVYGQLVYGLWSIGLWSNWSMVYGQTGLWSIG